MIFIKIYGIYGIYRRYLRSDGASENFSGEKGVKLLRLLCKTLQKDRLCGLLPAGGFYELWRWLKTRTRAYRAAFGVGLAGILFLGWVSGAVGIIGSENNPANLMYWTVPATLLIGSLISRFKPRGMARTLFATAFVQLFIPVFALLVWPAKASWGEAGVIGVFIINAIFAILFMLSAILFRRAGVTDLN